jgi:hypothetical protein
MMGGTAPITLAGAVVQAHGEAHPETIEIANLWPGVQSELAAHMQKKELMLFPYIKQLVRVQGEESAPPTPPFGMGVSSARAPRVARADRQNERGRD